MDDEIDTGLEDDAGVAPDPADDGVDSQDGGGDDAAVVDETPAWQGPSQDEWSQVAQIREYMPVLEQLAQALNQPDAQPDPLAGIEGLDPLDPDYTPTLIGMIEQRVAQVLDEKLGGVQSIVAEREQAAADATVGGWIDDAVKPHAEMLAADGDRALVEQVAFGLAVKNQTDGRTAITNAAAMLADRIKQARQEGRDALRAELENRANAPHEPGTGGGATRLAVVSKTEEDAALAFVERLGIA